MLGEQKPGVETLEAAPVRKSLRERLPIYCGVLATAGVIGIAAKTGMVSFSYDSPDADRPANLNTQVDEPVQTEDAEFARDNSVPISRVYVYRNVKTALYPGLKQAKGSVVGRFDVPCAKYTMSGYPADVMNDFSGIQPEGLEKMAPTVLRVNGVDDNDEQVKGWIPYSSDLSLQGYIPQCGPLIMYPAQPIDEQGHVGPSYALDE